MAKQKLSELPVATSINQNDLVYVVQSSTSRASNIATVFASATTGNIREHSSNLYFTNARARQSITVIGGASYDSGTGVINVNNLGVEYVANVNGANGQVILTTANIAEQGNLYFTNSRVVSALIQGDYIIIEANGRISSTSPGTITANDLTTSNVVELNNLFYTNTRVYSNISPLLTTANVAEVSNQYFTNARSILSATPATTQLVVTTPVFNYNIDQYSGDNPTIYVTAGSTISFSLLQGSSHPFAIRVSNGGSNYNTGLTHVATDGTISTGSYAQGKVSGKLFWKIPYELAGNTYVYQCTNHSSMVGSIVIENSISKSLVNITANSVTSNSFISAGSGVPTLESSTNINLAANVAVVVTQSVLRLASFTDGQVANLSAVAGDIVYNSTNSKFQGYTTSGWKDLH